MRKRSALTFVESLLVGIISGVIVIGLRYGFFTLDMIRQDMLGSESFITKTLWVVLTIGVALFTAFLLNRNFNARQSGEAQVQAQLLGLSKPNSLDLIASKLLGTLSSVFGGLPLGHGGPSMQVGAHVGKLLTTKYNKDKEKTMMLSGQAAGFAGAFSTPLSAVLFNLELIHKSFSASMILPSLTASIIADLMARHLFKLPPLLDLEITQRIPFDKYIYLLLLAGIVGLLGVFFNVIIQSISKRLYRAKVHKNTSLYITFGFSILLFIFYPIAQGPLVNLSNTTMISIAILLVIRLIFTILSFESNSMGGLFLPLIVIGALTGQLFGLVLNHFDFIDSSLNNAFIAMGMGAMLTATLRAPLFSIVFIAELTSTPHIILPLSLTCLVASIVSSQFEILPFYSSQLSLIAGIKEVDRSREKVMMQVYLSLDSDLDQVQIRDLKLPAGTLIISIYRYGQEINVDGHVSLHAGDLITLVTREDQQYLITELFH